MDADEKACLGFSYIYGIGPWKFTKLVEHFGSPYRAFNAPEKELTSFGSGKYIEMLLTFRRQFNADYELNTLERKGVRFISVTSSLYPPRLKEITDPPIGLFCRGNTSLLSGEMLCFGIVGTRRPSVYGQSMAKKFAADLASRKTVIVSGLALGIDTCAHQGALDVRGKTIAVLGCGVDVVYPRANASLYRQILDLHGLIISEFPPGKTVLPGLFISRNRIISGLSKGVLVVEGGLQSGSLITATYTANQGRELFALPGQVTTEGAAAPLLLLKQGAHLATDAEDILTELGIPHKTMRKKKVPESLGPEEQTVFSIIQDCPTTTDGLLGNKDLAGVPIPVVLSQLEIRGIIVLNQNGAWEAI